MAAAVLLSVSLPEKLTPGPRWLFAAIELVLLIPLTFGSPRRHHTEAAAIRVTSMALIGIVNLANFLSLSFLVHLLLTGGRANGHELILAAIQIWITNVLIFGLWYWELDRGGPGARTDPHQGPPDFLFPQMGTPALASPAWRPNFLDYLYVSFTNATAFSPTDAMPLTALVKTLMAAQALISLVTVALVAARAVNILG
ncbi:MAG: hypothetical protein ABR564_10025 [Candidatus Dormibacteria bacterium]